MGKFGILLIVLGLMMLYLAWNAEAGNSVVARTYNGSAMKTSQINARKAVEAQRNIHIDAQRKSLGLHQRESININHTATVTTTTQPKVKTKRRGTF